MQIPRPKKVFLKSSWKIEQEQSPEDESTDACRDWKSTQILVSEEIMKIEPLDEQCSTRDWKQSQNTGVFEFEIDLRVPGVPEEMVQQDEYKMKEIGESLKKY